MALEEFNNFFTEEELTTEERNKLDTDIFGIPEERKYPLHDKRHVLSAVTYFNKADKKYKPELARRIVKRAKELNIEWCQWFDKGKSMSGYLKDLSKSDQKTYKSYPKNKDNKHIKESQDDIETKTISDTPELQNILLTFSKAGITYDDTKPSEWKLKSPDEVFDHQKGNCHDTSYYVYKQLYPKYQCGILFFIEYNDETHQGGITHSVCYEKTSNGICACELSWDEYGIGTFPFNDVKEMAESYSHMWKLSDGFDSLLCVDVTDLSGIHPGMTLKEYVDYIMNHSTEVFNKEKYVSESYDNALSSDEIRHRLDMIHDMTTGTGDYDEYIEHDPDDCYCEDSDINGKINARMIAERIHEKYEADKKPPTGNQNCQLCSWCAEAQFRGIDILPRPVYSPRDIALTVDGTKIVENPVKQSFKNMEDMIGYIDKLPNSRWYVHVKWIGGTGGHEFLLLNMNNIPEIMDAQQGTVEPVTHMKTFNEYFGNIDWEQSFVCRMDDKPLNDKLLNEMNSMKTFTPWDAKLDIPYMLKEGMLSEEEADEYWKEHPNEAPEKVFTSGDFDKYGKDVDLSDARGPIMHQESYMTFQMLERFVPNSEEGYPDGVWLRPAMKGDLDYITMVEMDTLDDKYKNDPKIQEMIKRDAYESIPRTRIICYTDENDSSRTIGLLQAYQKDDYWYIGEIWLTPEFRGKGIGKAILEKEISKHDWLSLDVNKNNKHAIDLYLSLGFKIVSDNEEGYRMDLKKNSTNIQEGSWNDIKNGVNLFSNKTDHNNTQSKEVYSMDNFERDPSVLKMLMESDDEDLTNIEPIEEAATQQFITGFKALRFYLETILKKLGYKVTNDNYKPLIFKIQKDALTTTIDGSDGKGCKIVTRDLDFHMYPNANGMSLSTAKQVLPGFFKDSEQARTEPIHISKYLNESADETNGDDENMNDASLDINIDADGDGDAIDIGIDTCPTQNQYDPKEIEVLNKLIASEADAISDYFDGSKETRIPVLSKLYSDIGEEERFHIEQLLYAKSTITGEKYEPRDPKVRSEYEELLAMGMDEETAMTTAVDKLSISVSSNNNDEDMSEAEEEEIKENFDMLLTLSKFITLTNNPILESVIETNTVREDLFNEYTNLIDELFMEEVDNLNRKSSSVDLGSGNPIKMVLGAFRSIYKVIIGLVKRAKTAFLKVRLRDKRRWAWIKKHGIKGLFQNGVYLYFYSDKRNRYEVGQALTFIEIINEMNEKIVKNCKLNVNTSKYNIDGYLKKLSNVEKAPVDKATIIQRIKGHSIEDGMKDLQGMLLQKTKLVVTDTNEAYLEELFFGYTDEKYTMIMNDQEGNEKKVDISMNVYNQLDIALSALEITGNETNVILEELEKQEGQGGIYASNPKIYNTCVKAASLMVKSIQKFVAAMTSDIKTIFDLNRGLKNIVDKIENVDSTKEERKEGKKELDEYNAANKERSDAAKKANDDRNAKSIKSTKYRTV